MVAEKEAAKERRDGGHVSIGTARRPRRPGQNGELRRMALRGVVTHISMCVCNLCPLASLRWKYGWRI